MQRYTDDFFILAIAYLSSALFPFLFTLFVSLSIFSIFRYARAYWLTVATPLQRNLLTKPRFIMISRARQMTPRAQTVPLKRMGNCDRVFYFARFVLDVKTMLALVD